MDVGVLVLLPVLLTFAAGAMLSLVLVELAPQAAVPGGRLKAVGGAATGAATMLALAAVLGV